MAQENSGWWKQKDFWGSSFWTDAVDGGEGMKDGVDVEGEKKEVVVEEEKKEVVVEEEEKKEEVQEKVEEKGEEKKGERRITREELAANDKENELWLVIEGVVYDVFAYLDEHPGGADILKDQKGKDATFEFQDIGHSDHAISLLQKFKIGVLVDDEPAPSPAPSSPVPSADAKTETTSTATTNDGGNNMALMVGVGLLVGAGVFCLYRARQKS